MKIPIRCRILLTVLCSGLFLFVSGQQSPDSIPWSPKVLYMHTWKDSNVSFPYAFRVKMRIYPHTYNDFDVRYKFRKADVVWLTKESWMKDSVRNRYLALSQLYFDIAEWKARTLQEIVNCTDTVPDLVRYRSEVSLAKLIDEIGEETRDGADSAAMKRWQFWADSALTAVPRRNFPAWEYGKISLGIHGFSGMRFFTGSLQAYVGNVLMNGLGMELFFNRFMVSLRAGGGAFLKKGQLSVPDYSYSDSSRLGIHYLDVSTGFNALRNDRFSVTPCLGLNAFRLINKDQVKGSFFYKSRISTGWSAGMTAQLNLRDFVQNAHARTGLQLWCYAGYSLFDFMKIEKGGSFTFQLGMGFHIKTVVPAERKDWNYYF